MVLNNADIQSEIPRIMGSPEGVEKRDVGFIIADALTGKLYVKQTPATLNTGWLDMTTGGGSGAGTGNFVGHGSPEGTQAASPGAHYLDLDNDDRWVKKTGIGTTGWI